MNFFANITEAVGGLFGGPGPNGATTGITAAPPSSSSSSSSTVPSSSSAVPLHVTPALRQEQGEIGNIVSLRVFDPSCTFDCHRLVIDTTTKTKAISRDVFKLVITNKQLILLQPLPNQPLFGRVTEVYELQALAKLKYHKSQPPPTTPSPSNASSSSTPVRSKPQLGLIILELKTGKGINYAMTDPLPAVEVLKQRMQDLGITGNITRPAKQRRIIANAQHCLEQSKEIQMKFSLSPSLALIEEMMDLLKTATEKFAEVDDKAAFQQSIEEIHRFLQRDDVRLILDGQPVASTPMKKEEGEEGLEEEQGQAVEKEESLLDTPSVNAPQASSLLERRGKKLDDMSFLSPTLFNNGSTIDQAELVKSVKHELLSAMSPRPFRIEEDHEVRELHAKAITFEDIDDMDFEGEGEGELEQEGLNVSRLLFDKNEEGNGMATTTGGVTDAESGEETVPMDADIHELSAMLDDMDNELDEILGRNRGERGVEVAKVNNNSKSDKVFDKMDYDLLGLEDFDKLLDEI